VVVMAVSRVWAAVVIISGSDVVAVAAVAVSKVWAAVVITNGSDVVAVAAVAAASDGKESVAAASPVAILALSSPPGTMLFVPVADVVAISGA
jgi:hypothetical protein